MSWSDAYIGIPYRDHGRDRTGADCWGLFRLPYADICKVELPGYDDAYVSAFERREVAGIINSEEAVGVWQRVSKPKPFDMLLFRQGRDRCHIGCFVSHGLMLHIHEGISSRIENYQAGQWRTRLTGIYRYTGGGLG